MKKHRYLVSAFLFFFALGFAHVVGAQDAPQKGEGKRRWKEKPAIRTSIFAFRAEKKENAHNRAPKDERGLLGLQDLQGNLGLRGLPGRLVRPADKF